MYCIRCSCSEARPHGAARAGGDTAAAAAAALGLRSAALKQISPGVSFDQRSPFQSHRGTGLISSLWQKLSHWGVLGWPCEGAAFTLMRPFGTERELVKKTEVIFYTGE